MRKCLTWWDLMWLTFGAVVGSVLFYAASGLSACPPLSATPNLPSKSPSPQEGWCCDFFKLVIDNPIPKATLEYVDKIEGE